MAGDGIMETGESYSVGIGLVYIFNLIVGTGALTMPHAFSKAGWLLSLLILIVLAFMSYLTATFVIEAMASANALLNWRAARHMKKVINEEIKENKPSTSEMEDYAIHNDVMVIGQSEKVPLLLSNSMESLTESQSVDYYNITERIEMGKMASIFFSKFGMNAFYFCIAIYLYGDLAIYGAAVSKSIRDVACSYTLDNSNFSNGSIHKLSSDSPCWSEETPVSRGNAYRIFLTLFIVLLGPFTFFNVQKTKYLQMLTTVLRWIAFISMIALASRRLIRGEGTGKPVVSDFVKVPNLFGVCVYSFMCHHSLPSLVTPVKRKDKLYTLLGSDYVLILFFYALLSFTGIFAFENVADMYTLNFQPGGKGEQEIDILVSFASLEYFLALFPVFTLSTNFPIIAITLRNNLKTLFLKENTRYSFFIEKVFFPIVTIIPPIAIAYGTESLEILVGFTGSYAGTSIQYIVPALLVYFARKDSLLELGLGVKNNHVSPFKHKMWIWFVLVWAGACIICVTVDHIIEWAE